MKTYKPQKIFQIKANKALAAFIKSADEIWHRHGAALNRRDAHYLHSTALGKNQSATNCLKKESSRTGAALAIWNILDRVKMGNAGRDASF